MRQRSRGRDKGRNVYISFLWPTRRCTMGGVSPSTHTLVARDHKRPLTATLLKKLQAAGVCFVETPGGVCTCQVFSLDWCDSGLDLQTPCVCVCVSRGAFLFDLFIVLSKVRSAVGSLAVLREDHGRRRRRRKTSTWHLVTTHFTFCPKAWNTTA